MGISSDQICGIEDTHILLQNEQVVWGCQAEC